MCTNIALRFAPPQQGGYAPKLTARTLDLGRDLATHIDYVPAGTTVQPPLAAYYPAWCQSWPTVYAYVAASNYFSLQKSGMPVEQELYSDGLNEHGLSAAMLSLPGTTFPAAPTAAEVAATTSIGSMFFVAYVLGNYATIDDLLNDLQLAKVGIVAPPTDDPHALAPLFNGFHFVVQDATQRTLVLEYLDNTLCCYDSDALLSENPFFPVGTLTNAPPFAWHLANLSNYSGLQFLNNPKLYWGQEVNGSGLVGMPGDSTPPSRFVQAAYLSQPSYRPTDQQQAVNVAIQVIKRLAVPTGIIVSAGSDTEPPVIADKTQWGVVRDHLALDYFYFSQFSQALKVVHLATLKQGPTRQAIPITDGPWVTDMTPSPGAEPVAQAASPAPASAA